MLTLEAESTLAELRLAQLFDSKATQMTLYLHVLIPHLVDRLSNWLTQSSTTDQLPVQWAVVQMFGRTQIRLFHGILHSQMDSPIFQPV